MAYTQSLDPAVPAGSDPIASGDDKIRALTQAIKERLLTLVEDIDADPLVLTPEAMSTALATLVLPFTNQRVVVPACAAQFPQYIGSTLIARVSDTLGMILAEDTTTDWKAFYPVILPNRVGPLPTVLEGGIVHIKRYRLRCQRLDSGDLLQMALMHHSSSGAIIEPTITASSGTGVQFLDSGAVDILVHSDEAITVVVNVGAPTSPVGTWIGELYVDYDIVLP